MTTRPLSATREASPNGDLTDTESGMPIGVDHAPGPGMRVSSRSIQIALGCLWVLDGLLQLQAPMFGRGFIDAINYNDVMSQPAGVAHFLVSVVALVEPRLLLWNPLFAATQIAIGLGLLYRPTVRPAIVVSIAWALVVWVFGEGLGGLFTGLATLLGGAPGPVLLYPLIGLIAWPVANAPGHSGHWRRAEPLGKHGARISWAGLWVGGAILQVQPVYPFTAVLASTISMNLANGEPALLASMDTVFTRIVIAIGDPLTVVLALLEAAIGLAVLRGFHTRPFLGLGIAVSILFWIVGQNFGGILTGQSTDPGSGPLFVLLALALYPAPKAALGQESSHLYAAEVAP